MHLEGQAAPASAAIRQRGFALAALLVAIAILSVMMLVALPAWRHQMQREKEAELIFRGEQYARAIGLYQRKIAGTFPPSLDALVDGKYLRRKYKDPITGDDFVPIYANSAAGLAAMRQGAEGGGRAGAPESAGPDGQRRITATFQSPRGGVQPGAAPGAIGPAAPGTIGAAAPGGAGGIVGVTSKSKAQAIRLYNGRDRHDQWIFTYTAANAQAGQGGETVGPGQQPRPQPSPGLPARGRGRGGQ